ncbi:hypothetical protein E5843_14035 [Luteimonas yindakuii]|uniref:hypothetical protein n=1 Tax=Luteimonas yindakuii TaxID=2565782 RepID=UPI0010A38A16|nr:hypothetical protein [Luteimonas yindakuii]QCO68608.1 hypothetical protein E5843_14035 [Luteimonas yindakuii]
MSVERSQSAENAATARLQDSLKSQDAERAPPPRENVDRFREVLRQAGSAGQEAREEFAQARQQGAGELRGDQRAALQAEAANAAREAGQDTARVDAVHARSDETGDSGRQTLEASEIMAMMQAQSALREGAAPAPVAAPASSAGTFADLLERHVRQLAVGGGTAANSDDGQVLLRMSDASLPGTDLLLSRTETGWLLRADTRSRGSYDAIREAAPDLAQRFADRALGTLEIDPHWHA